MLGLNQFIKLILKLEKQLKFEKPNLKFKKNWVLKENLLVRLVNLENHLKDFFERKVNLREISRRNNLNLFQVYLYINMI